MKTKIILIVIIVIVIGGLTVLVVWNFLKSPTSEEVIERMIQGMKNVKTFHCELEREENIKSKEKTKHTLTRTIFDSDISDIENIKLSGNFYAREEWTPDEIIYGWNNDFIVVDGLTFTKYNHYKDEEDDIKYPTHEYAMLGKYGDWVNTSGADYVIKIDDILELFEDRESYYVRKNLSDKKINDVKVYHYEIAFKELKKSFLIPGFLFGSKKESSEIIIDVYIGKKDNLLYGLNIYEEIIGSGNESSGFVKVDLVFSDYNKPLDIKIPENYKRLEDVLYKQTEKETSLTQKKDSIIRADLAYLRVSGEIYVNHNKSYLGFCKSDDINKSKDRISEYSKLVCNDSSGSWAVAAKLTSANNYFCVDSKGNAKEISNSIGDNTTCL